MNNTELEICPEGTFTFVRLGVFEHGAFYEREGHPEHTAFYARLAAAADVAKGKNPGYPEEGLFVVRHRRVVGDDGRVVPTLRKA